LQVGIRSMLSEKCVVDLRICLCRLGSSIATGRPGQTLYCFVDEDRCRGKCLNCKVQACRPNDPLINTVKVGCASKNLKLLT
jgi:hypothetical protein